MDFNDLDLRLKLLEMASRHAPGADISTVAKGAGEMMAFLTSGSQTAAAPQPEPPAPQALVVAPAPNVIRRTNTRYTAPELATIAELLLAGHQVDDVAASAGRTTKGLYNAIRNGMVPGVTLDKVSWRILNSIQGAPTNLG